MFLPSRQNGLEGPEGCWCVVRGSNQDLETSKESDHDENMLPVFSPYLNVYELLGGGENRAGGDQVRVLVHDDLQALGHPHTGREAPVVLRCSLLSLFHPEKPGVVGVSQELPVVEGTADAGVRGDGLEEFPAVSLLAVQETSLQQEAATAVRPAETGKV